MMESGILVSNLHDWQVWIGHRSYDVYEGMMLEIKIENCYFKACLGKDQYEWFLIIEEDCLVQNRSTEL